MTGAIRLFHGKKFSHYVKHITGPATARSIYPELRIGVCNCCRGVVPFDCKLTHLHHEIYDEEDPLRHTLELCPKCHNSKYRYKAPRRWMEY